MTFGGNKGKGDEKKQCETKSILKEGYTSVPEAKMYYVCAKGEELKGKRFIICKEHIEGKGYHFWRREREMRIRCLDQNIGPL